jgi:hypothetical protein
MSKGAALMGVGQPDSYLLFVRGMRASRAKANEALR